MSKDGPTADDTQLIRSLFFDADVLLLDFDGPICSVFAGIPASYVARRLRGILESDGHSDFPIEIQETADPFAVFRYAAGIDQKHARSVESALTAYEMEAVSAATSTAGAHELLTAWARTGRKSAVVSNNSTAAVYKYLQIHQMTGYIDVVTGRESFDPGLLKPSSYLIKKAVSQIASPGSECLFIGDSVSDIDAALAAGIKSIGYANRPSKVDELRAAGADAIVTTMTLAHCMIG